MRLTMGVCGNQIVVENMWIGFGMHWKTHDSLMWITYHKICIKGPERRAELIKQLPEFIGIVDRIWQNCY